MGPEIRLTVSPQEYFQEKVLEARTTLKVELTDDVQFYIVNLLASYVAIQASGEQGGQESTFFEKPLAFMLRDASEAPDAQKPGLYRALGDTSLYITGFFQDFFNRKTFAIDYYIALGRTGYEQAAKCMNASRPEGARRETLTALADNFVKAVDVVAEVSEQAKGKGPVDILNVYDRWTKSQSERLRRILADQGIDAIEVPYKIAQ
ncbi:MAG: hypothetical protein RIQ81_1759 [Pseudomonadota bacterium]